MVSLNVLGPPAAGTRFPLNSKREFVIGRSEFCDIVLNKRSISREHARIFERDGEYFIEDLKSLNGTSVNGRPISGITRLSDGCRINLYDVPLAFFLFDDGKLPSSGTIPVFGGTANGTQHDECSKTKRQTRLDDLLDIIQRLGSSLNVDVILPKVLDILFHMFPQAVTGEILLLENDKVLSPRATRHGRETDTAMTHTFVPPDRRMTQTAMETNSALIDSVGDASGESALESTFASTMYVPIVGAYRKPLGMIVLESEDPHRQFANEDLILVAGVAMMAAQAIAYARAHEMFVEYERTRLHLGTAREIQLRMLPRESPKIPGYDFAHFYRAAQSVGGDAYIYHRIPDGRIVAAVADASGKGLPASLRIADFISEFRHCVSSAKSLKSAMEYLNKHVCQLDEGFITVCLAVLDPKFHTLSVANAGHPPPFLRHRDGTITCVESERNSFPFGLVADEQFHPVTISLNIGDEFVLFTDGVTEAFDCEQRIYGLERMICAMRLPAENATKRIQQIVTDIERFRRGAKSSDDQCIVAVARIGT